METKNYESRLEEAKKLYQTANKDQKYLLESLFPEIIEDEDERVRKVLLDVCDMSLPDIWVKRGIKKEQVITWLEKQGEQKTNYCHHEVDLSGCSEEYRKAYYDGWNNCNMQHSQCKSELNDVVKCLISGMKFYYDDNEEATCGTEKWSMPVKHIIEVLEKQVEQKPIIKMKTPEESLGIDSDTYNDIVDECIYGEQKPADMAGPKDYRSIDPNFFKPADKVEPKFKVGDCITDGEAVFHITSYDIDYGYQLETQKGTSFHFSDEKVENKYHLWTIKDAKDGDVLYSPCLSLLWIFKSRDTIYCGCNLNYNDGAFCGEGYFERPTDAIPATKEQRELLFQKMKEAGYEWDADKKELKKKSQRMISAEAKEALYDKPAWSEEDEKIFSEIILRCEKYGNQEQIDWLKSLKEKYTWKPSDEQIRTLEYYMYALIATEHKEVLFGLYNDLKKLKGE